MSDEIVLPPDDDDTPAEQQQQPPKRTPLRVVDPLAPTASSSTTDTEQPAPASPYPTIGRNGLPRVLSPTATSRFVNPGQEERSAILREKCLSLRTRGKAYSTIARITGCSKAYARTLVMKSLANLAQRENGKAVQLRQLELERMDRLLDKLEPGIRTGSPKHVMAAVRISDRRARLLGLDAPQKSEHTGDPATVNNTLSINIDGSVTPTDALTLADLPPALVMQIVHIMREKGVSTIDFSGPLPTDGPVGMMLDYHSPAVVVTDSLDGPVVDAVPPAENIMDARTLDTNQ